jgi:hypothetical protein
VWFSFFTGEEFDLGVLLPVGLFGVSMEGYVEKQNRDTRGKKNREERIDTEYGFRFDCFTATGRIGPALVPCENS